MNVTDVPAHDVLILSFLTSAPDRVEWPTYASTALRLMVTGNHLLLPGFKPLVVQPVAQSLYGLRYPVQRRAGHEG
jgi:hypothetical protein